MGVFLPAKTPAETVSNLNNAIREALKKLGATVPPGASEPGAAEKTILQVRITSAQ